MPTADNLATFMIRLSEIWQTQPSGTVITCTGIAFPLYVVSSKLLKILSEAFYLIFIEIKCN